MPTEFKNNNKYTNNLGLGIAQGENWFISFSVSRCVKPGHSPPPGAQGTPGTAATPEERGCRRRVRPPPPPSAGSDARSPRLRRNYNDRRRRRQGGGTLTATQLSPTVTARLRGEGEALPAAGPSGTSTGQPPLRGGGGAAHRVPADPAAPQRDKRSGSRAAAHRFNPRAAGTSRRSALLRSSLGAAPLTAAGRFLPSSAEGRAVTSGEGGALSRKEARGRFAKQRPDRTGEGCSVPRGVLTPAPGAERPGRGRDECWELCRQRPQQRGCPRPGRARRRQGRFTLSAVRGSWKLGRDPVFSGIYVSFCADSHFLPLPAHQHPFSPFRRTTPIPAAALFFTSEPGSSHERSGACVHPHSSRNSYCYLKLTSLSLLIYTVLSRGGFGVFFFFFLPQLNTDIQL